MPTPVRKDVADKADWSLLAQNLDQPLILYLMTLTVLQSFEYVEEKTLEGIFSQHWKSYSGTP